MKRPTIEGLPSPAVAAASQRETAAAPAIQLDLVRSVRMRPRLAAGVALAVFVLLFGFGLSRRPMYTAESLTYVEPLASKVLSDGASGTYDPTRYDSYLQQQMQTALRPDILEAAISKLPPGVWRHPGESMQSAVARLQASLKVQRVSTSYQLSISLMDGSPQNAAAVVNAVTNAYLEQGRNDEHAVASQRLKLLGEERQRIQQQLDEDRVEQARLGVSLGVANPAGLEGNPYDAQVAGVQSEVAGAREAHDLAAAQMAALQGSGGSLSPALQAAADEQINGDAGLNSMKGTITQRKAILSTQMAGLTPSNPIYKQDQEEIADLDRSLDAMTQQLREKAERRLQDKMRADLARTADVEGRLSAQLARQTRNATSAAPKLQRASQLVADIERLNARYSVVDDAIRGLELESNGPGSAHLSVAAAVPVTPEPSRRKLILLLALPLGLFAGGLAAVFALRRDPRIYSGPDVERVLGFSPIGVMPAREEVSARVMEEYTLRLAAGLQDAYRVSSAQSFVFTAASPGIQTTEFVHAIERLLRSLGFNALVMNSAGVLGAAHAVQAAQSSHAAQAAQASQSKQRMAAGHSSREMVRVLEGGVRQGYATAELDRLKREYDLVLIDAPPLLHSAETEYLVRCADATILIAESGITLKAELFQSAVLLRQLNVAGVGAILQELHLKDADPVFQAAVAAVERIQRSRHEEPSVAPVPVPRQPEPAAVLHREPEDSFAGKAVVEPVERGPVARQILHQDSMRPAPTPPEAPPPQTSRSEASTPEPISPRPFTPEPAAKADEVETRTEPVEASSTAPESAESAPIPEPAPHRAQDSNHASSEVPEMKSLFKSLQQQVQRAIGKKPAAAEPEEILEPFEPRDLETVLFFEDRLRPNRETESQLESTPAARTEAKLEPLASASAAEAQPAPPEFSEASHAGQAAAAHHGPAAAAHPEPLAEREPPFWEVEAQEVESAHSAFGGAEPAFEQAAQPEVSREMTSDDAMEHAPVEFHFDSPSEPERAEAELEHEPVFLSAVDLPAAVVREDEPAQPEAAADAEPADASEQLQERAPEPQAIEPQPEAAIEILPEPAVAASAPVVRPAVPAAPRREPAAPKMEWVTLRFRGTTERVLRIVPSDEDQEFAEGEGVFAEEPQSIGYEAQPEPETVAEAMATKAEEPIAAAEDEAEYAAPTASEPLQTERVSVESEAREELTEELGGEAEGAFAQAPEEVTLEASPTASELEAEPGLETPPAHEFAEASALTEAFPEEAAANEQPLQAEELMPEPLAELERAFEATEPFFSTHAPQPDRTPEEELISEAESESTATEAIAQVEPESWAPEPVFEPAAPAFELPVAHIAPELRAEEVEPLAGEMPEDFVPESPKPRARVPVSAWSQGTLEIEAVEARVRPEPMAESPAGDGDRFSPLRLVSELRSRSAAAAPREDAAPAPAWSRRSAAAPVEERLEPRARHLTRRWEMLSRFDSSASANGSHPGQEAETAEVAAASEPGGR